MHEWMWYLTRATGIVAALLAGASLVWGLMFSSRNVGRRLKANWWLAMHNWLGGLALAFIGVHMLVAFADSDAGLRFVDLLVPSTAVGWAIGWGVVASWLFVVVTVPSVARIRRRLPRRAWHLMHLLAFPAVALTVVHALQSGSDTTAAWFGRGLAVAAGLAVYPLSLRLSGVFQSRRGTARVKRSAA